MVGRNEFVSCILSFIGNKMGRISMHSDATMQQAEGEAKLGNSC